MPGKQPLYLQLAELIEKKILSKEYVLGTYIPSERELCESYGVSRMTVRKAISLLEENGLLSKIQGKGTIVRPTVLETPIDSIQAMGKYIRSFGFTPTNKVFHTAKRRAGIKYSRIFGIDRNDFIFELFRLRLADGRPFAIEYTYVPSYILPHFEDYNFEFCSLYDLYAMNHIELSLDNQDLEIVRIDSPQSDLLKLPKNTAVFMLHNTVKDSLGRVVEYTRSYLGKDTTSFSTVLKHI